jgi:hypothetical protein
MGKLFDALPDSFLRKVLDGEDPEIVENLLSIKAQFERETDKDRKIVFKERLTAAFWNVYVEVGKKISPGMTREKRLLIRFGLFDLKYLTPEDQKLILGQPFECPDPENSVYYVDEWLLAVAQGNIKPSVVDEAGRSTAEKKDSAAQTKYERVQGSLDGDKRNYQAFSDRRKVLEDAIVALAHMIANHGIEPLLGLPDNYSDDQIRNIDELVDSTRDLKKIDRDMRLAKDSYYRNYEEFRAVQAEIQASAGNVSNGPANFGAADIKTMENELNNAIRQMVKMAVGRQGNHFPMLVSNFLPRETSEYNYKGNFLKAMINHERLDPTIFQRTFKGNTNRIPPYIILLPGYGNFGICWEPYDKYNKATSKGRVAVPIFTKSPKYSIATAMGDFRWQCAKEMAGYHWMDPTEGLSGKYYEYLQSNKIRGDVKTMFIEDYRLWIEKESEGIQKIHKDVRFIFWRNIPFPDEIKESLKNKGFYYSELYEKEKIFKLSQG